MRTDPHILEGIHYATGRRVRLTIGNGIIRALEDSVPPTVQEGGAGQMVIAPGLTDLQVNGFMGVDFNDPALTAGQVETTCSRLLQHGVTAFCPTLITGPPDRTSRLLGVISEAVDRGGLAGQMIAGIHLEGPFISPENGPRGAHPEQYCMDPDPDLFQKWYELAGGRIGILTLAPELPGSEALIRSCREMGVVAAIGHTAAVSREIRQAVEAGATLSTHLGNGCHSVLPRHPNYIWDQLAEERLYASFIADGFHLPDAVLKVFMAVKGEKAVLVSDSMEFSGMPPGLYDSPATGRVVLTPEGRLHKESDPGTLAGSASLLLDGVRRIARIKGLTLAWNMASLHPAELLALPGGHGSVLPGETGDIEKPPRTGIDKGAAADLVLLDRADPGFRIIGVVKNGVLQETH